MLTDGLLHAWRLDTPGGCADGAGGHSLEEVGSVPVIQTPRGAARQIGGSAANYLRGLSDSLCLEPGRSFAVAGWVCFTDALAGEYHFVTLAERGFSLLKRPGADGRIAWYCPLAGVESFPAGNKIREGEWTLVAACWDAERRAALLSVDGGPFSVRQASAAGWPVQGRILLGRGPNHRSHYTLCGMLAGWSLWSRVLTPGDVAELYSGGFAAVIPTPRRGMLGGMC